MPNKLRQKILNLFRAILDNLNSSVLTLSIKSGLCVQKHFLAMFFQLAVVPANLVARLWIEFLIFCIVQKNCSPRYLQLSLPCTILSFVYILFNSKSKLSVHFSGRNCCCCNFFSNGWMSRILLYSKCGYGFDERCESLQYVHLKNSFNLKRHLCVWTRIVLTIFYLQKERFVRSFSLGGRFDNLSCCNKLSVWTVCVLWSCFYEASRFVRR